MSLVKKLKKTLLTNQSRRKIKWQECYQGVLIIVMLDPKRLDKEEESILNIQRPLVTRLARDTEDKENETPKNR